MKILIAIGIIIVIGMFVLAMYSALVVSKESERRDEEMFRRWERERSNVVRTDSERQT